MKAKTAKRPCGYMEKLLQGIADGQLKGIRLWFAMLHAAICPKCAHYVQRMRMTLASLREQQQREVPSDVLARLEKKIPSASGEAGQAPNP